VSVSGEKACFKSSQPRNAVFLRCKNGHVGRSSLLTWQVCGLTVAARQEYNNPFHITSNPVWGRSRATARGQSLGRPFKLTPHQRKEAVRRRDKGEETLADIGRSYNVSAATISRLS
jgi:hypothetical protein